jgi:hypothetical protein
MSSPYNSTPSASSYPAQSRDSQPRQRPTDTNSGSHAQQTGSSRQPQNIVSAFAGPSTDTNPPAYSQDSESPPGYRKLTQIEELEKSLQSQVRIFTQQASIKADASKSKRRLGSHKQSTEKASQQRSMANLAGASLNYMHSGSVSHLGAAHDHLKSIVQGKPSVTEANKDFCKLRTDAFLAAALPSVNNPALFTWEGDSRIQSPDREARLFWTTGLDSKSQRPVAKFKMSS